MVVSAYYRLLQASNGPTISISEMSVYHEAYNPPCRLEWFIDAIQLIQRIRAGIDNSG